MNILLFLAMLFIASCRQEHSSSCCKLRNMCSCCGVGQGERRFIAVLEIELWMLIKANWTLSLAKRSYSVSCFSCQRLINKLEGCVEGGLTRSSVLQYSAIQLCLWKTKFLPCLSAYRTRKIPPPWDAEDTIFFLSLLSSPHAPTHISHVVSPSFLHLAAAGSLRPSLICCLVTPVGRHSEALH